MERTLAYAIAVLRRDFKMYCQQELSKLGVSLGQLYFLLYIGKYQPCTSKALAEALLVDAGLVNRVKSPLDKRSVALTLTAQGERAYERSRQLFAEWDQLALSYLEPAEAEAFMQRMTRLAEGRKRDQDNSQEDA